MILSCQVIKDYTDFIIILINTGDQTAFRIEIKTTSDDLENNQKETFSNHRHCLELYGFLLHWFLIAVEKNTTTAKITKKKSNQNELKTFDWSNQKLKAFDTASWLLDLKLSKIWTMAPERIAFINLFTKPAYQLFENPVNAKSNRVKERVFRILGLCVKYYDHAFGKYYIVNTPINIYSSISSCSNNHHAKSSILGAFS